MVKKNSKKVNVKKQTSSSSVAKNKKLIEDLKIQINNEKKNTKNQLEKYTRLLAEFDNYKRRTIKEKNDISNFTIIKFAKELITVLDDFDRTLDSVSNNKKDESYIKGIKLIFEKFYKILKDKGIQPFSSIGELFDPEIHEAISSQEDKNKDDDFIINEFLKGYKYKEQVIRHSKVVVVKNK